MLGRIVRGFRRLVSDYENTMWHFGGWHDEGRQDMSFFTYYPCPRFEARRKKSMSCLEE